MHPATIEENTSLFMRGRDWKTTATTQAPYVSTTAHERNPSSQDTRSGGVGASGGVSGHGACTSERHTAVTRPYGTACLM